MKALPKVLWECRNVIRGHGLFRPKIISGKFLGDETGNQGGKVLWDFPDLHIGLKTKAVESESESWSRNRKEF
jgi:hypothetical protein